MDALSDWERVKAALVADEIAGVEDFGLFVNDTRYFRPSGFDERAAMPALLRVLPVLEDAKVAATCAAHLRRRWARPTAFDALLHAFKRFAIEDQSSGWQIGNALATAADASRLADLLEIAADERYGMARQMIVYSMWRFRSSPQVPPLLVSLLADPAVAGHAASALRRTVGAHDALLAIENAKRSTQNRQAIEVLERELRAARKAIARKDKP